MTFSTEAGDVVTTEDHPFWNATDQVWQGPQEFDAGDTVLTADGALVAVEELDWDSSFAGLAYNLTVDDLHTYFVEVGTSDVLVHNVGPRCPHTAADIAKEAASLGYKEVKGLSGAKGTVFQRGMKYISHDIDHHKVGSYWKTFDRVANRLVRNGTWNMKLKTRLGK